MFTVNFNTPVIPKCNELVSCSVPHTNDPAIAQEIMEQNGQFEAIIKVECLDGWLYVVIPRNRTQSAKFANVNEVHD